MTDPMMEFQDENKTSTAMSYAPTITGTLVGKNTIIQIVGTAAPFAVAVVVVPVLIRVIGLERFGIFTLGNVLVGYLGLFDFGIGRAATKFIAEASAKNDIDGVGAAFWTALAFMFILGSLGIVVLLGLRGFVIGDLLHVPAALRPETRAALLLLALALPFVISANAVVGLFSAYQRFDLLAGLRIPFGAFAYVGPLLATRFSPRITSLFAVLLVARIANWFVLVGLSLRLFPFLRARPKVSWQLLGSMVQFGGWITVSAIVSPLMDYLDRLIVGNVLSLEMVSFYTVPWEVMSRIRIIPGALASVLFPAFSSLVAGEKERASELMARSCRYLLFCLFPLAFFISSFAPELFRSWLGPLFVQHSTASLRWLMVALLLNSTAYIPYSFVQSLGRPDLTAKFHLGELFPFLFLLYVAVKLSGVTGAAVAWTIRVGCDTLLLLGAAGYLSKEARIYLKRILAELALAVFLLILGAMISGVLVRSGFFLMTMVGVYSYVWLRVLGGSEKQWILNRLSLHRLWALQRNTTRTT